MKKKCVFNRERKKPNKELSVKLFGTHTVNTTANLTFKQKTLGENPSISTATRVCLNPLSGYPTASNVFENFKIVFKYM